MSDSAASASATRTRSSTSAAAASPGHRQRHRASDAGDHQRPRRHPGPPARPGENALELAFVADIAPAGASIIRSHDPTDGSDYLYTLLVPADANQLFPCFDQPDLKARVHAHAHGPPPAGPSSPTADRLAPTPPGRRDHAPASPRPGRSAPISSPSPPGRGTGRRSTADGRTDHRLRAPLARGARPTSTRCSPSTAGARVDGALLRPALPVREVRLRARAGLSLRRDGASGRGVLQRGPVHLPRAADAAPPPRPRTPPSSTRSRTSGSATSSRCAGSTTSGSRKASPRSWRQGARTTSSPSADAWKTFYLGNKPAAYAVDQTAGTRPLWQELANLDQAKSNYGAIVYNKAPAVLKQLNYLVGDTAFRRGCGVSRDARVRQRRLAGPARRHRAGGGPARWTGSAGTSCCGPGCRWWISGWWCGMGGSCGWC